MHSEASGSQQRGNAVEQSFLRSGREIVEGAGRGVRPPKEHTLVPNGDTIQYEPQRRTLHLARLWADGLHAADRLSLRLPRATGQPLLEPGCS